MFVIGPSQDPGRLSRHPARGDPKMAFDADFEDGTTSARKQRRQKEDRKRMAYRRAIEEYRESQALHAEVCDFPDISTPRRPGIWLH